MTRLRTAEGIDLDEAAARFGTESAERIRHEAARWIEAGVAELRGAYLALPPRRMLLSDAVIESLFET